MRSASAASATVKRVAKLSQPSITTFAPASSASAPAASMRVARANTSICGLIARARAAAASALDRPMSAVA